MKILLAEDDFASRKFMDNMLSRYGECDVMVDGEEAVDAFMMAHEAGEPYDLACLDVIRSLKQSAVLKHRKASPKKSALKSL